ncbi:MAG TPA: permease prefix domain 1-containing protein [Oscillospiraceae bacterium]|nr:permease prefix domain 1-containing protein [Oscillospiraceae bacterium]
MQQPDKISEYLETVRQQIRWKKAQPILLEEIKNHIIDQKEALLAEGLDESTATDQAIAEMGDPVIVGEQLDRVHKPKPDWSLLILTGILLLVGLAFQSLMADGTSWTLADQLVNIGFSIGIIGAAYFIDFTIIGKYPKFIFFALCVIIIMCYFFTGRANRGNIIYLLLLMPTAFAGIVYSMRNRGYGGLVFCVVTFLIPAFLSMLVPSYTVFFLLGVSCLTILTGAVLKGWFHVKKTFAMLILYIPIVAAMLISFFMVMNTNRLKVILNPALDPKGEGFPTIVIQKSLSCSRFIGRGLPTDLNVYDDVNFIPKFDNDYLLTYFIYRFGWIVLLGIIALFIVFIIRSILLCKNQKSVLGFLTSLAIIATFAMQCILYIVSNLGFLLFDPLSLPLIFGNGMFLAVNMLLVGLLLSVSRTGAFARDTVGRENHYKFKKPLY